MTTKDKVARRKQSLLELARELENVSRACKVMGYSRHQLYEIHHHQPDGGDPTRPANAGPKLITISPPKRQRGEISGFGLLQSLRKDGCAQA